MDYVNELWFRLWYGNSTSREIDFFLPISNESSLSDRIATDHDELATCSRGYNNYQTRILLYSEI